MGLRPFGLVVELMLRCRNNPPLLEDGEQGSPSLSSSIDGVVEGGADVASHGDTQETHSAPTFVEEVSNDTM